MSKPPKTTREVESLLSETMRERYPTIDRVGLLRRRGRGWRCFVQSRRTENNRAAAPIHELDQLLADIAEGFEIVEEMR